MPHEHLTTDDLRRMSAAEVSALPADVIDRLYGLEPADRAEAGPRGGAAPFSVVFGDRDPTAWLSTDDVVEWMSGPDEAASAVAVDQVEDLLGRVYRRDAEAVQAALSGGTLESIGERLGCPTSTLSDRLRSARQRLEVAADLPDLQWRGLFEDVLARLLASTRARAWPEGVLCSFAGMASAFYWIPSCKRMAAAWGTPTSTAQRWFSVVRDVLPDDHPWRTVDERWVLPLAGDDLFRGPVGGEGHRVAMRLHLVDELGEPISWPTPRRRRRAQAADPVRSPAASPRPAASQLLMPWSAA